MISHQNPSRKSKYTPYNLVYTFMRSDHIMTPFNGLQKHHFTAMLATPFEALHIAEIFNLLVRNKILISYLSLLL